MSSKRIKLETGSSGSDLSSKQKALANVKESINKLEIQLQQLHLQQEQLEHEIASLKRPTIKDLPPEVLTYVFYDVIYPDFDASLDIIEHQRNRLNLMLVCKHWYTLIIGSPSLWSKISIIARSFSENILDRGGRQLAHMTLALSRSGSAPLDVIIDFIDMGNFIWHGLGSLESTLGQLIHPDEADEWREWLHLIPWASCPTSDTYHNLFRVLILRLMGDKYENIGRWRSLILRLPADPLSPFGIISLFDQPIPNLRFLYLEGDEKLFKRRLEDADPRPTLFLAPQLKVLELENDISLDLVQDPSCIEELTIMARSESGMWNSGNHLSQFTSLKVLKLSTTGSSQTEIEFPTPIQLPVLDELHLRGPVPTDFLQALSLDRLSSLTVDLSDNVEEIQPLSDAKIFNVTEVILFDLPDSRDPGEKEAFDFMSSSFPKFTTAHTLGVPNSYFKSAVKVINSLKKDGGIPSLKKILALEKTVEAVSLAFWFDAEI